MILSSCGFFPYKIIVESVSLKRQGIPDILEQLQSTNDFIQTSWKWLQLTRMTHVENEALLTFFNRLRKNILANFTDIKFKTA